MTNRSNSIYRNIYISVTSGDSRVYKEDDVLRGVVRVDPQARPQRVNITFRGRMKCYITRSKGQSSVTYHEKPDFFSRTLELFSSTTPSESYDIVRLGVTKDDRVDLPFEFRWPKTTELPVHPRWSESVGERFEHQPGGPLPPSYSCYTSSRDEQRVEYFLEAKLYTDSKASPHKEVRCFLKFRPTPLERTLEDIVPVHTKPGHWAYQGQRGIRIQTRKLSPDYDPHESLKHRIKDSWSRRNVPDPFAVFKIATTCPSVLFTGEMLNLQLSLEHGDRSPEIADPPRVYLRRFRFRISSWLYTCIPRAHAFSNIDETDDHNEKRDFWLTPDNYVLFDGAPVKVRIPPDLVPSFKSYGLALEYVVQVKIWGECAESKFESVLVLGKVVVASRRSLSGDAPGEGEEVLSQVEKGGPSRMDGDAPPLLEDDASPPAYQVSDKNG